MIRSNPTKCYYLVGIIKFWFERLFGNLPLSAWYLWILTPNMEAHLSSYAFNYMVSYWLVLLIRCKQVTSLRWSTTTWLDQRCGLDIFLRILVLFLAELTGVDILRLHTPVCCQCLCVWTLIYSLLLSTVVSLMFQTCIMQR